MTRKECENLIIDMLKDINDVYHQYNPDGEYLAMAITENISVNNRYYDEDKEKPINVTLFPDGDVGRGYTDEDGYTHTEYERGEKDEH